MKRLFAFRHLGVLLATLAVLFGTASLPGASANGVAPTLSMTFDPDTIELGQETYLVIDLTNSSVDPVSGLGFTVNLPAGLESIFVAPLCNGTYGGSITQLTYSAGSMAASSSCDIRLRLKGTAQGVYTVTIDELTYNFGSSETTTGDTATLTVTGTPAQVHDACYAAGGSESDRNRCDAAYRNDLRAECVELYPTDIPARLACYREANDLYLDARRNGRSDFNQAQQPAPRPPANSRRR